MIESTVWKRSVIKVKDAFGRWRGDPVERDLACYQRILDRIRACPVSGFPDSRLREMALWLKRRAGGGEPLDGLLVECYALVIEAARRVLGIDPFDVQVMAGIAMHQGKLVEMPTGEGKTLAAVFPACLNALAGKGVHVFTANDYLAGRDAAWMGPVYEWLGIQTGCVKEGMDVQRRQQAYGVDVTYLTAREAGFDFLREHLCYEQEMTVHRPFNLAIVDEADFILIDEARVPLVIAGEVPRPPYDPRFVADLARRLELGVDFTTDENRRNVFLSEKGIKRMESLLECGNLYDPNNQLLLTSLNLALHARALLRRDIDYIVREGKIEIVDEFTGRVADRRRWPDGIQQAVEAREGVCVQQEGRILGSITLQHFVKLYPGLCGMTATAQPAAEEIFEFYGMKTVVIPPHKKCIRVDYPDEVFTHREAKYRALVEEIIRVHESGRPVLVGTASVGESEILAGMLMQQGISCRVLNAKNDAEEARIVADAGKLFAVTISTNMAGRGTDIRLGGADGRDHGAVAALGGLYVIGTNRHESRRIDFQLRGRSGRQGDPGSSRFFISLEDDLLVRYNIRDLLDASFKPQRQEAPLEDQQVTREIARCQRIIEDQNFQIRKTLFRYSSLVEEQRKRIYAMREHFFLGMDPSDPVVSKLQACLPPGIESDGSLALPILRRMALHHLDELWSEHLAVIADIREGIHLVRLYGKQPLDEFQFQVHREFCRFEESLWQNLEDSLRRLPPISSIRDLEQAGIKAPASTWTYLINDNPFSEIYSFFLLSRNIGFAASIPLQTILMFPIILPLLLLRLLKKRFQKKGKR